MNDAFLLIGGNLGKREENLEQAKRWIEEDCGKLVAQSSVYETAAWGMETQPAFLNQALKIRTALSAKKLLTCLLAIEKKMGRIRDEKWGPRKIDIDILLFNDDTIHEPGLAIPHPRLHLRRFVLVPLNEIAPGLLHPALNKTIEELLTDCPDALPVQKL